MEALAARIDRIAWGVGSIALRGSETGDQHMMGALFVLAILREGRLNVARLRHSTIYTPMQSTTCTIVGTTPIELLAWSGVQMYCNGYRPVATFWRLQVTSSSRDKCHIQ